MSNKWSWAWFIWAAGVASSFAWLERMALKRHYHPTLSTTMRRVLGIDPKTPWGKLGLLAFAACWTCLVVHIARIPPPEELGA
jgi:hypothetical protein